MQEALRERMTYVGGTFGRRFSRRQKNRFLLYLKAYAEKLGLPASAETVGRGHRAAVHVAVGDLAGADVVVMTAYDTPPKAFCSRNVYHPLYRDKNRPGEMKELLLRFLAALLLLSAYILIAGSRMTDIGTAAGLAWFAASAAAAACVFKLITGIANKYNFRRNSAAVVLMMDMMKRQRGKRVAWLFADRASMSYEGLGMLPETVAGLLEKKKVLWLDCLGLGDYLCIAGCEQALEGLEERKEGEKCSGGLTVRTLALSREEARDSILYFFPRGLCLVQCEEISGEPIVKNTRSSRDDRIEFDRLADIEAYLLRYLR